MNKIADKVTVTIEVSPLAHGYSITLWAGAYNVEAGCGTIKGIKPIVRKLIDLAGDHLIPKEGGA